MLELWNEHENVIATYKAVKLNEERIPQFEPHESKV